MFLEALEQRFLSGVARAQSQGEGARRESGNNTKGENIDGEELDGEDLDGKDLNCTSVVTASSAKVDKGASTSTHTTTVALTNPGGSLLGGRYDTDSDSDDGGGSRLARAGTAGSAADKSSRSDDDIDGVAIGDEDDIDGVPL
jgi:hypothetical protein